MKAIQSFLLRRVRRYADVGREHPVPAWALRLLANFARSNGEEAVAKKYARQLRR